MIVDITFSLKGFSIRIVYSEYSARPARRLSGTRQRQTHRSVRRAESRPTRRRPGLIRNEMTASCTSLTVCRAGRGGRLYESDEIYGWSARAQWRAQSGQRGQRAVVRDDRHAKMAEGSADRFDMRMLGKQLLTNAQPVQTVWLVGGFGIGGVGQADLHDRDAAAPQAQSHGKGVIAAATLAGHVTSRNGRTRQKRNDGQAKQSLPYGHALEPEESSAGEHGLDCKAACTLHNALHQPVR